MRTIASLSLLMLLIVGIAYGDGQCPGVYLYTDMTHTGCDGLLNGSPNSIYIWVYAGSKSAESAEFSIYVDPCAVVLGTVWDPSVTFVLGDVLSGVTVSYLPCESGWHCLGYVSVMPTICVSLVAEVMAHPGGVPPTSTSPRLFGCAPDYELTDVYGGKAYIYGTSHPPCEEYGGPDLMIGGWGPAVVPDTAVAGKQIPFPWFRVRNGGCEDVSSFTNGYYLSTDAVITGADVLLASTPAVSGLGVYGDTTFSDTVLTIPLGTAPGEYYVGILADNSDAVTEDDETNNSVSTQITVVATRVWHILPDGSGDAPTIQAGIDSASCLDTVLVACGTYHEHDIMMKSGLTLISETGEAGCVRIEADSLGRVIYCDSVSTATTIQGFTMTEGLVTSDHAGAMYLTYSSPTIRRCDIMDNSAVGAGYDAGGVRCHYSSPHFIECVFSGNTAEDDAGGIYCRNSSSPEFEYCIFADNTSSDKGGAMLCYDRSNASLYKCTFYGNSAGYGSAIAAMESSLVLAQNTIVSFGTAGEVAYCDAGTNSDIALRCSDVYGNVGGDWVGCIAGQDVLYSNFSDDPLFCEPDSLDFALEDTSPCLDVLGCGLVGALGEGCGLSAIGGERVSPAAFNLHTGRPNPSSQSTRIAFSLARAGKIEIAVYDARGRRIALLARGHSEAGEFELTWDGTDGFGEAVPSGIYFCRFRAGGQVASQKIVLIR